MGTQSLFRRALVGAGLALAVLAQTVLPAGAQPVGPGPRLEPLRVYPGGQQATVEVYASEDVTISYSLREGSAQAGGAAAGTVSQPQHRLMLTGLKSNTTYTLTVRAKNRMGKEATAETTFTTLKRRVRVTLDSITVHSDGDLIGSGEPTWFWTLGRPVISIQDCFPSSAGKCKEGSFGTGTITPLTSAGVKYAHVFAEENFLPIPGGEDFTTMPADFVLKAKAVENDAGLGWLDDIIAFGAFLSGASEASWHAPRGGQSASDAVALDANDGSFRSTMRFRFELFHDNTSYPPTDGRVHSTSK